MYEEDRRVCRLCLHGAGGAQMVRPCKCRGLREWAHRYCFEEFTRGDSCTACEAPFDPAALVPEDGDALALLASCTFWVMLAMLAIGLGGSTIFLLEREMFGVVYIYLAAAGVFAFLMGSCALINYTLLTLVPAAIDAAWGRMAGALPDKFDTAEAGFVPDCE
jgi:hypothetical protein